MTPNETDRIIALIVSAWPHANMPAPTMALWAQKLAPFDAVLATQTVSALMDTCRYLPTWAEFLERYDELRRPRPQPWDATRALPAVPVTRGTVAKQHVAEIRATLAKANGPLAKGLRRRVTS